MTKVLKFCACCHKPKMLKNTHNYAYCRNGCGPNSSFVVDKEKEKVHLAKREASKKTIDWLLNNN